MFLKVSIVIGSLAIFVGVLKLACRSYCIYIPGIVFNFKNPRAAHHPITWESETKKETDKPNNLPNIVLILSDDLGFNDISFFGGGIAGGTVPTPHIDSVGRAGVSFNVAYAGHATCAPSRASLMTGRFSSRVGLEYTPVHPAYAKALATSEKAFRKGLFHADKVKDVNTSVMVLPAAQRTLAEEMKSLGYRTLMLGKWHLGATHDSQPMSRGFDEVVGFHGGILSRYLDFNDEDSVEYPLPDGMDQFLFANLPYSVTKDGGQRFAPNGYLTDYLADEACAAIQANRNRPFFMYLPFSAPHTPFQALRSDVESLPTHITDPLERTYAAMVVALDRAVGKVLAALMEHKIENNTLVIFANDNGAPNYALRAETNKPFRGFKGTFFEGGIRVPLFMRWPARIPAGLQLEQVVSLVDLFPTAVAAASGTISSEMSLDGVNLLTFIDTAKTSTVESGAGFPFPEQNRTLFWRSGHYMALRDGHYKVQVSENPPKVWLHNLAEDPTERVNLAEQPQHAALCDELIAKLRAENARSTEPLWPSLTETAICIDKLYEQPDEDDRDEYVYWPN